MRRLARARIEVWNCMLTLVFGKCKGAKMSAKFRDVKGELDSKNRHLLGARPFLKY